MDKTIFEGFIGQLEAEIEQTAAAADDSAKMRDEAQKMADEAQQAFDEATVKLERLKAALKELSSLAPEGVVVPIIPSNARVNFDRAIVPKKATAAAKPSTNGRPREFTEDEIKARILRGMLRRGKRTKEHTTPKKYAIPGIPTHDRGRAYRILADLVGNGCIGHKKTGSSDQYWITDVGTRFFKERLNHISTPTKSELVIQYIGDHPGSNPATIASRLGLAAGTVTGALTVEMRKGKKSRIARTSLSTYYPADHPGVQHTPAHS